MKNLQDGIWLKEIPVEQHRVRITAAEEGGLVKSKSLAFVCEQIPGFYADHSNSASYSTP
ncbi:MAG: hypothetical protein ACTHYC_05280 [Sphingobacterium sp.]